MIATHQGKLLPIPESVPFRMTADMVDGMGTTGTQGVFQRCAEETLRVLRADSEVILTVLEVFKYDPLHSWYGSPPCTAFLWRCLDVSAGRRASSRSNARRALRRRTCRARRHPALTAYLDWI